MNGPTLILWCGGVSALLFALMAWGALWLWLGITRASRTPDESDALHEPDELPPPMPPSPGTRPDESGMDGDDASADVVLWDGDVDDVVLLEVDEAVNLAQLRARWQTVPANEH